MVKNILDKWGMGNIWISCTKHFVETYMQVLYKQHYFAKT